MGAFDRVYLIPGQGHAIPVGLQQLLNAVASLVDIFHYQDDRAGAPFLSIEMFSRRRLAQRRPSCQKPLSQTDQFDRSREPQKQHNANSPPVDVDFVPGKSMARGSWVSMMVVVPAFTKGQQRDPPVVP